MSDLHNIIAISGAICPSFFVEKLTAAIHNEPTEGSENPQVESVRLKWECPPADASKLVKEGDRKCRVYDEVQYFADRGVKVVALPNFQALTFLSELQVEFTTPIANIGKAVAESLKNKEGLKLGYLGLASEPKFEAVKHSFEGIAKVEWVVAEENAQKMLKEYELKFFDKNLSEEQKEEALSILRKGCQSLQEKGAELILPSCTGQVEYADALNAAGFRLIDIVGAYAHYLCTKKWEPLPKPFKLGIVGGMGPAATVDLYDKITRATPAKIDQDHFKGVIEQNPQIPDRTKYRLHGGIDPTLSLYSCCKKLEADQVDAIVFPCNTAHAYIETIVPHLDVPIINMQRTTLEEIKKKFGEKAVIGLMATDGTCETGIYSKKADEMGLKCVRPDPEYQKYVMEAIYGEKGVKAGYTTGVCRDQLLEAAKHLVKDKAATVLILGCTELPLILDEDDNFDIDGKKVAIVDPTSAVARKVVTIATLVTKERGRK